MIENFILDVVKTAASQPVIIFSDETINDVIEKIRLKLPEGFPITDIPDQEKASKVRMISMNKTKGIFVCHASLQRGFDLKLARDAYVFILVIKKGFALSEVRQMLGRGSRAFGTCTGAYYTCEFEDCSEENIIELLKLNEPDYLSGPAILQCLYETNSKITGAKDRKIVADVFKAKHWIKRTN